MKASKQYLRFCGIDVAKQKHIACIIDQDSRYLVRPKSILNDAAGYQQLLNCLKQSGRKKALLAGMEAKGHYWYALHDFLNRDGYTVAVLNPIQTAQQAKQAIRKCKTDKYDAFHIANLLRCGQYKAAVVPGDLALSPNQRLYPVPLLLTGNTLGIEDRLHKTRSHSPTDFRFNRQPNQPRRSLGQKRKSRQVASKIYTIRGK